VRERVGHPVEDAGRWPRRVGEHEPQIPHWRDDTTVAYCPRGRFARRDYEASPRNDLDLVFTSKLLEGCLKTSAAR
jgi:hypothetical protein